jgi:hypothetical protein
MKKIDVARIAWLALTILALAGGLLLLSGMLLPFQYLKSIIDSLAADHNVETFTVERYQALRQFTALAGAALLAAGGMLIIARQPFQGWLKRLADHITQRYLRFAGDLVRLLKWTGSQFSDRRYLAALGAITLIAALIRFAFLSVPIRYDEAYTFLVFAMRPLRFIASDYHVPNNHIFHTILVRLAYLTLGNQLWSIRLPVFVAGILLIPAAYLAGKVFFERRTALLGAALAASSSILVEYAANARGYMMVSLFGLAILTLAAYLKTRANLAAWVFFVIFSALGFYTIPIFLYPFGMVVSWLLLSILLGDLDSQLKKWDVLRSLAIAVLAVGILTGLLYLPVFRVSGISALTGNRYVSSVEGAAFIENILVHFRNSWQEWTRDLPRQAGIVLLVGLLLATVFNRRLSTQRIPFLIPAGLWILVTLLIQRVTPWPRVWLFLLPFVLIWSAGGWVGLFRMLKIPRLDVWRPAGEIIYILAVVGLAAWLSFAVYQAQSIGKPARAFSSATSDEEAIAIYLKSSLQAGDVVASAIPFNYPLRYYFLRNQLSPDYFYKKTDSPNFVRAYVIVSRGYNQTLDQVLAYTRLGEAVRDAGQARLVYHYRQTDIYEIPQK